MPISDEKLKEKIAHYTEQLIINAVHQVLEELQSTPLPSQLLIGANKPLNYRYKELIERQEALSVRMKELTVKLSKNESLSRDTILQIFEIDREKSAVEKLNNLLLDKILENIKGRVSQDLVKKINAEYPEISKDNILINVNTVIDTEAIRKSIINQNYQTQKNEYENLEAIKNQEKHFSQLHTSNINLLIKNIEETLSSSPGSYQAREQEEALLVAKSKLEALSANASKTSDRALLEENAKKTLSTLVVLHEKLRDNQPNFFLKIADDLRKKKFNKKIKKGPLIFSNMALTPTENERRNEDTRNMRWSHSYILTVSERAERVLKITNPPKAKGLKK